MFTGGTIWVLTQNHIDVSRHTTVDGQNPAPPKKPWETILGWYLRGIIKCQGFLGGKTLDPW